MLPHWDRSCSSNFPSHPVTVYWHWANQPSTDPVATAVPVSKSLVWLDPRKIPAQAGFEPGIFCSRGRRLNHQANKAVLWTAVFIVMGLNLDWVNHFFKFNFELLSQCQEVTIAVCLASLPILFFAFSPQLTAIPFTQCCAKGYWWTSTVAHAQWPHMQNSHGLLPAHTIMQSPGKEGLNYVICTQGKKVLTTLQNIYI